MALSKREIIVMLGFVLIYAFLVRGMVVGEARDFWHDEAFQYEFSKMPVSYILDSNDVHPPLFTLITKGIIDVFNPNIHTLRFLMVGISMCFLISFFYVLSKIWDKEVALLATMLISFAPTFVYYSTEFRSYIFVLLIAIWQIYYFNLMIKFDRKFFSAPVGVNAGRWWIFFSLVMIYSHYMAGLLLLVQLVYLVVAEKEWYLKRWFVMGFLSLPLGYYIIKTLPKIQSFWFKDIDFISLISTFAYILSPPLNRPVGWGLWVYGIAIFTLIYFRKDLTKKHLQFGMYLILPIITMWIISQLFPFYHHRYFLFGGMAIFPLVAWGVMQWSRKKEHDVEQAMIALIIVFTMFSLPELVNSFDTEVRDSAIFLYNYTSEMPNFVVGHDTVFSQTPYRVYFSNVNSFLLNNMSDSAQFTAGGAVVTPEVRVGSMEELLNKSDHVFFVSDKKICKTIFEKGGLYLGECK